MESYLGKKLWIGDEDELITEDIKELIDKDVEYELVYNTKGELISINECYDEECYKNIE